MCFSKWNGSGKRFVISRLSSSYESRGFLDNKEDVDDWKVWVILILIRIFRMDRNVFLEIKKKRIGRMKDSSAFSFEI